MAYLGVLFQHTLLRFPFVIILLQTSKLFRQESVLQYKLHRKDDSSYTPLSECKYFLENRDHYSLRYRVFEPVVLWE